MALHSQLQSGCLQPAWLSALTLILRLQDEREERELRKVEMQTQKAENMIEHEAEIYARPPRTWFQTEKQKKESAKRGRPGADEEGESKGKGNKRQKKEEGKGKKEKASKEDRAKQKRGDELLAVSHCSSQAQYGWLSCCLAELIRANWRGVARLLPYMASASRYQESYIGMKIRILSCIFVQPSL